MIPRSIIISSISRKLSGNRWYNQTQWLMISGGYRWPLYVEDDTSTIKRLLPRRSTGGSSHHTPDNLTVPGGASGVSQSLCPLDRATRFQMLAMAISGN